jgi:hypothetical protein
MMLQLDRFCLADRMAFRSRSPKKVNRLCADGGPVKYFTDGTIPLFYTTSDYASQSAIGRR